MIFLWNAPPAVSYWLNFALSGAMCWGLVLLADWAEIDPMAVPTMLGVMYATVKAEQARGRVAQGHPND